MKINLNPDTIWRGVVVCLLHKTISHEQKRIPTPLFISYPQIRKG